MPTYSQRATIDFAILGNDRRTDEIGTANDRIDYQRLLVLQPGTGDGEINQIYRKSVTVTGGEENTFLDLTEAASAFDSGAGLAYIKCIIVSNKATAVTDGVSVGVIVGTIGELATPFASDGTKISAVAIRGGGFMVLTNPGTGWAGASLLTLSSVNPVPVDVMILGVKL